MQKLQFDKEADSLLFKKTKKMNKLQESIIHDSNAAIQHMVDNWHNYIVTDIIQKYNDKPKQVLRSALDLLIHRLNQMQR